MEGYGDYRICFSNGDGSSSSSPYQRRSPHSHSNPNGVHSNGSVRIDSESTAYNNEYEKFLVEMDLYNKMFNMSVRGDESSSNGYFHVGSSSFSSIGGGGGGGGSSTSYSDNMYKPENHCGSYKAANINVNGMYNIPSLGFERGQGSNDPMASLFNQGVSANFNGFNTPSMGLAPYTNGSGMYSMNSSQNMHLNPYSDLVMMRQSQEMMKMSQIPGNMLTSTSTSNALNNFQNRNSDTEVTRNHHQTFGKAPESSSFNYFPWKNPTSVAEIQSFIFPMAKDQNGCRYLQRVFEEGNRREVQIIFNEIIYHIVELMMDQFGNYLVQKLLDVCNEEQVMKIVKILTRDPKQIIITCLDTHGTRVVQKLILTIHSKEQIALVISALKPGFMELINDLNGSHVIKRCLECFTIEENKFIHKSACDHCVKIATHRHGCCVLQNCISRSSGKYRSNLVAEICAHALILAQDPFGNYIVQYVMNMKIPSAISNLMNRFKGRFVPLSTQKFSSHVVEKCIKEIEMSRSIIVQELLSVPHFEDLLQDAYANYVIYSALNYTKGPLQNSLIAAIAQYGMLRTNPYCKKIFSHKLLMN